VPVRFSSGGWAVPAESGQPQNSFAASTSEAAQIDSLRVPFVVPGDGFFVPFARFCSKNHRKRKKAANETKTWNFRATAFRSLSLHKKYISVELPRRGKAYTNQRIVRVMK
jgi:hypothetical protein